MSDTQLIVLAAGIFLWLVGFLWSLFGNNGDDGTDNGRRDDGGQWVGDGGECCQAMCPDMQGGIYFIWAMGLGRNVLDSVHEILRII